MKRWRLSICTLLSVVMLAVSFFVPVEARTLLRQINVDCGTVTADPNSKSTVDINLTVSSNVESSSALHGDLGTVVKTGSFDMTCRLPYNALTSGVGSFADADSFSFIGLFSCGYTSKLTKPDFVSSLCKLDLVGVDMVLFGQTYKLSPYDDTRLYWIADISGPIYPSYDNGNGIFFILHYTYTAEAYSNSATHVAGTAFYTFTPSLSTVVSFSWMPGVVWQFYSDNAVTTSDLNNQTNSINNKIQQETQKQTDSLENGYDNSGLNTSNNNLSASINDYDATESQITDSSVANIDAAEFQLPNGNAALTASISFGSTFLQSLFVNMGDWSLLVTVSLSLALGLMLIGWFKYR